MKGIPGTDSKLLNELGRYVDRVSVNIELPSEKALRLLAPQKSRDAIMAPMKFFRDRIAEQNRRGRKGYLPLCQPGRRHSLSWGASGERPGYSSSDGGLYRVAKLKRVYYSAYVPVMAGKICRSLQGRRS